MGGEVVQDHVDRGAVGAGGADRPEGGQGVRGALAAPVDAPQGVVADRVAAVEVRQDVLDPVELGVVLGVGGLLSGPDALEGDALSGEQASQGLAADPDHSFVDFAQVDEQFCVSTSG
ncbi:hypothetical protein GCM10020229_24120 [Kitasatospora albolonga]